MMLKKYVPMVALAVMTLTGCQSSGTTNGAVNVSDSPQSTAAATSQPTEQPTVQPTDQTTTPSGTPVAGTSDKPSKVAMTGVTAVRLADVKSGWIGGNGWIAHTDDSGAKWQVQYEGKGDVKQVFALNGQEAWASVGTEGSLLSTKDGGQHWASVGKMPNAAFFHFVSKGKHSAGMLIP